MEINKVEVVGRGLVGAASAQVYARVGFQTVVRKTDPPCSR